ncbi:MAG: PQQ-binding-like beta-propeller repeat protein [Alphaproteobacteria bacterium]
MKLIQVLKHTPLLLVLVLVSACVNSDKLNQYYKKDYTVDIRSENKPDTIGHGIAVSKIGTDVRNTDIETIATIKNIVGKKNQYHTKSGAIDVNNNTAFIMDSNGVIVAYDTLYNKQLWKNKVELENDDVFRGQVKVVGNNLIAIGNNGSLFALNVKTGEKVWKNKIDYNINSTPSVYSNNIIFQLSGSKSIAIDSLTGEMAWGHQTIDNEVSYVEVAPVKVHKGISYVMYSKGELFAINSLTGEEYWGKALKINLDIGNELDNTYFIAKPIIKNDNIYLLSSNNGLYVLNRNNGRSKWNKNISGVVNMATSGDILYILDSENKVWAIDVITGKRYWSVQLKTMESDNKIGWNSLILHRGRLILFSELGKIQLLSIDNGETIAVHKGARTSSYPIQEKGLVYILLDNGNLKVYR